MIVQFEVGDVVRLKKAHPCGSVEWEVTRVGADIGLKCRGCGHRVMMERSYIERRMKGVPVHADTGETGDRVGEG